MKNFLKKNNAAVETAPVETKKENKTVKTIATGVTILVAAKVIGDLVDYAEYKISKAIYNYKINKAAAEAEANATAGDENK
jgi:hypothetical protein